MNCFVLRVDGVLCPWEWAPVFAWTSGRRTWGHRASPMSARAASPPSPRPPCFAHTYVARRWVGSSTSTLAHVIRLLAYKLTWPPQRLEPQHFCSSCSAGGFNRP